MPTRRGLTNALPLIAAVLLIGGCAASRAVSSDPQAGLRREPIAASGQKVRATTPARRIDPLLLRCIPAAAQLAATASGGLVQLGMEALASNSELAQDLSKYYTQHLGPDLTLIDSVALFVLPGSATSFALCAKLKHKPAGLKGKAATTHRGVAIHPLDSPWVIATVEDVVVIGTMGPSKLAVDGLVAPHKTKPNALVAAVEAAPPADLLVAADLRRIAAPGPARLLQGMLAGAHQLRLSYVHGRRRIRLEIDGDSARLNALATQATVMLGMLRQRLAAARAEAVRSGQHLQATQAIVAYHVVSSIIDQATPKMVGNRLVSELTLPQADAQLSLAMVGIAAAVAIPAYMRFKSRAAIAE